MLPLSANVPAAKLSAPPLATLNEPAHVVVQLRILLLAFSVPAPLMVPPTQLSVPLAVRVPVPPRVPAVSCRSAWVELVPLSVSVPPLKNRFFTKVVGPATVRGPPVTLISTLLVRLAMVWFAAASEPTVSVRVPPGTGDPMQTLSEAPGTPPVQLAAVPH